MAESNVARLGTGMSGVSIVGYGQTVYEKRPTKPTLWYCVEAARLALEQSGFKNKEVDGLGVSSFMLPPDNTATVAEHLGVTLKWGYLGTFGGASQVIALLRAVRAIQHGDAEVIVLISGDAYSVGAHEAIMDDFNMGMRDYLAPYGMGGTNGLFAMLERRHRYEFGTSREQLGRLAVVQRHNASLNPNALLRNELTMGEYLAAPLICDPIRLFDCVLPCGGGEAVVVTSTERARALPGRSIAISAGGERTNYDPDGLLLLSSGWTEFAPAMYDEAGLGPSDCDVVELYDDYPIMEVIQLESLGFCPKGEGGAFLLETDIGLTGTTPINTGGGQLSCGQSGAGGGGIGLTEAVIQLMGHGAARQVEGATTALVTGFGMVGYVKGLCQAAVILQRED